ncbi:MAG: DNA translocase FtsK [Eggerthellaceae bacterium]|nr:DNA translocase FtsK [Eggerthellaceae bacterium]
MAERPARGKRRASAEPEEPKRSTRRRPGAEPEDDGRVLDSNTRRDIVGVAFIVAAVVLLLCAVLPAGDGAVVTSAASNGLHLVFGVGAYILPLFLVAMGVGFLVRFDRERVPVRMAIGLSVIFVALLALIALFTPTATLGVEDPSLLFGQAALVSHGGYIGAGIAWCGITLFGKVISGVLLVGVMVVGAIIIGFSVSNLIARLRAKRQARMAEGLAAGSAPFGRIRRGGIDGTAAPGSSEDVTAYMPLAGNQTLSLLTQRGRRHSEEAEAAQAANPMGQLSPEALAAMQEAMVKTQAVYGGAPAAMPPVMPAVPGATLPAAADGAPALTMPFAAPVPGLVPLDPYGTADAAGEPEDAPFEEGAAITAAFAPLPGAAVAEGEGVPLDDGASDGFDDENEVTYSVPSFDGSPATTITRKLGQRKPAVTAPVAEGTAEADPAATQEALAALAAALTPVSASEAAQGEADEAEPAPKKKRKPRKSTQSPLPLDRDGFLLPPPSMLAGPSGAAKGGASQAELQETAERLHQTLEDFGIPADVVGWVAGPTVTLFKVDLPSGVRVSRVTALNDDIALALAAPGVRIFAPIPNTNYVGIEVPNRSRQTVLLSDVLGAAPEGPLQIAIGKDVEGNAIVSDLAKMPHLLIGGTTGSGKSVSINAMIMSILMRATPAEVRFIMIDPKRVEFTPYNGIPHLYVPVVTEPKEASSALSWGVAEMERRLKVFSKVGARNISQFNAKVEKGDLGEDESKLPYIVIIIDELADLMMNVGKEVEFSISRIAQLARAAGIHLIVATQRPSTNVVTGLIKANITNRIAFNVASGIDSRVVLDTPGAENLIGLGDLLLSKPELAKPQRIQGCYVSEDEIFDVVEHLKGQGEPEYHSEILTTNVVTLGDSSPSGAGGSESDDPLLWEAAEIVVSAQLGSTSNIQRRLKVGYARAGRIMDQLEEKGVVGAANGSRPREVLVEDVIELETLKAFDAADED